MLAHVLPGDSSKRFRATPCWVPALTAHPAGDPVRRVGDPTLEEALVQHLEQVVGVLTGDDDVLIIDELFRLESWAERERRTARRPIPRRQQGNCATRRR